MSTFTYFCVGLIWGFAVMVGPLMLIAHYRASALELLAEAIETLERLAGVRR